MDSLIRIARLKLIDCHVSVAGPYNSVERYYESKPRDNDFRAR